MDSYKKKLLISFSGGETSAFMTQWLLSNKKDDYEMIVVFANTGEENEEALRFVNECDNRFGFNTVWVEAIVNPIMGEGTKAKVVDFKTASRNGEPFEAVIAKYGIPSSAAPHCSKNLKRHVIQAYARSIGWSKYYTAIGVRNDEIDRVNENRVKERIIYPLIEFIPTSKPNVNKFWSEQPFRLRLKGYEGNCKWCWKKSLRKHLTIALENPSAYDFPERMEKAYENYVAPTITGKERKAKPPFRFFRGNMTVADIKKASEGYFEKANDDSVNTVEFQKQILELDFSNGCIESCEVY